MASFRCPGAGHLVGGFRGEQELVDGVFTKHARNLTYLRGTRASLPE